MGRLTEQDLKDLIAHPDELRFDQIQSILYAYGYRERSSKGSHFRFIKENWPSITVPVHHNKVKKWYVKDICKILLSK